MSNITVRNIPDKLHKSLQKRAKLFHRSLNNEIIASLEEVLFPSNKEIEDILEKSEEIRAKLKFKLSLKEINNAKREGRT